MSSLERPGRRRRSRPPARRTVVRALLVAGLALLCFLLGIAFSRALDERPATGDPVTTVRTLSPREQQAPPRTVTVTTTRP